CQTGDNEPHCQDSATEVQTSAEPQPVLPICAPPPEQTLPPERSTIMLFFPVTRFYRAKKTEQDVCLCTGNSRETAQICTLLRLPFQVQESVTGEIGRYRPRRL
ncbi:unnamed protein product, partial [Ectocarpus sp. 13 AM-2016]